MEKFFLRIAYNCDTSFGPKDEWVLYEGEGHPQIGEGGFGKTNCLSYASIQSCEFTNCNASGGIITAIESYSRKKAIELELEADPDLPLIHEAHVDLKEIHIVECHFNDLANNLNDYFFENNYSSFDVYLPKRIRKVNYKFALKKNLKESIILEAEENQAIGNFGLAKCLDDSRVKITLFDRNLNKFYNDLLLFFKFRTKSESQI